MIESVTLKFNTYVPTSAQPVANNVVFSQEPEAEYLLESADFGQFSENHNLDSFYKYIGQVLYSTSPNVREVRISGYVASFDATGIETKRQLLNRLCNPFNDVTAVLYDTYEIIMRPSSSLEFEEILATNNEYIFRYVMNFIAFDGRFNVADTTVTNTGTSNNIFANVVYNANTQTGFHMYVTASAATSFFSIFVRNNGVIQGTFSILATYTLPARAQLHVDTRYGLDVYALSGSTRTDLKRYLSGSPSTPYLSKGTNMVTVTTGSNVALNFISVEYTEKYAEVRKT